LRSVILLMVPGTGKPGDPPFRVFPIEDTKRAFPAGSMKVLNMSPTEVMFEIEDQKYHFKSGSTQLLDDLPETENMLMSVRAFCRIGTGNAAKDWKRIEASRWPHPERKRTFQVL